MSWKFVDFVYVIGLQNSLWCICKNAQEGGGDEKRLEFTGAELR